MSAQMTVEEFTTTLKKKIGYRLASTRQQWRNDKAMRDLRMIEAIEEAVDNPIDALALTQTLEHQNEHKAEIKELGKLTDEAMKVMDDMEDLACKVLIDVLPRKYAERATHLSNPSNIPAEKWADEESYQLLSFYYSLISQCLPQERLFNLSSYEEYLEWIEGKRELDLDYF